MGIKTRALAAVATVLAVAGVAPGAAPAADRQVHLNQIQTINTHNSYHREISRREQDAYDTLINRPGNYESSLGYSHASFARQFGGQDVRGLELDLWGDPQGGLYAEPLVRTSIGLGPLPDPAWRQPGIKVMHTADADYATTCVLFTSCLRQVKQWSDANPEHVPIFIMLELKRSDQTLVNLGGAAAPLWDNTPAFDQIDAEIRSVFRQRDLVTPDDVRKEGLTLDQSVSQFGWPALEDARGKILFVYNNVGSTSPYSLGRPNLEGRLVFPNAAPGQPNSAYHGRDEVLDLFPIIQDLVRRNYLIRTRSDISLSTVRNGDERLIQPALDSGAQMISTDFPTVGMSARYGTDLVVQLPEGGPARCNPVNAPPRCRDDRLEPPKRGRR